MLYVGMTDNLIRRMNEHKTGKFRNSFTVKYNISQLLYFEKLNNKHAAAIREKQLKGWIRAKKIELIKILNPRFKDLSENWYITRDPSLAKAFNLFFSV